MVTETFEEELPVCGAHKRKSAGILAIVTFHVSSGDTDEGE